MGKSLKKQIMKLHGKGKSQAKAHDSVKSLFNEAEYDLDQPAEQSEFDIAYIGKPSKHDAVFFDDEYRGHKTAEPRQVAIPRRASLFDDDEEDVAIKQKRGFVMSPPPQIPISPVAVITKYEAPKTRSPDEDINVALAIAEDCARREGLLIAGGSPILESYMDFDHLNSLNINKCIVEFLRINGWIKGWFPSESDYEKYTLFRGNYRHLPLEEKIRIIDKIKLPNISVCEKVPEHYDYWQKNFNPNPADCCNLRIPIASAPSNGLTLPTA